MKSTLKVKRLGIIQPAMNVVPRIEKRLLKFTERNVWHAGLIFEKVYGPLGKNFIEVHHTKPLSSVDEEVVVDSEKDLVVLCSNCHSMIHPEKGPCPDPRRTQKIIESNRGKSDNLYKK